jgi:hypothetical protein
VRKWRDLDYLDVPRGRVHYKKGKKPYVIVIPKSLDKHKSLIRNHFGLPSSQTQYDRDDHYEGLEEDFDLDSLFD